MQKPLLGCGVGLRSEHYKSILDHWPKMDWFEAITENFMDSEGQPIAILEKIRARYPIGLHGVSLSIGSADGVNPVYLEKLEKLAERIKPAIISDHLCWTGIGGENLHDLLPLPFTEEAIDHVVRHVDVVQSKLKRTILLENVSSYVTYKHSTLSEWEFLSEVARRSGCGILLDINNIYVNAFNHKFDASTYIQSIPVEAVGQFHLAGHSRRGNFLFDTHNDYTIEPVWKLYEEALARFGKTTTLIEWDANIPVFEELAKEAKRARGFYEKSKNLRSGAIHCAPSDKHDDNGRDKSRPYGDVHFPKLSDLQKLFTESMHPDHPKKSDRKLSALLNPQGGDRGIERIGVYSEGYIARFQESLSEGFPTIRKILGDEIFADASKNYAEIFISQDYNLTWIGKYFPGFLKKSSILKKFPYFVDLAALEWEVAKSFHGALKNPADLTSLSKINPEHFENLRFEFQPTASIISSEWPIGDIWNAKKNLEVKKAPQDVLVYRSGFKVLCEKLSAPEAKIFLNLQSGKTLGQAFEALTKKEAQQNLPVSEWFSNWASKGLILSFTPKPLSQR